MAISYKYMSLFLRTLLLKFYPEALQNQLVLKIIKGTFLGGLQKVTSMYKRFRLIMAA